MRCIFIVSQVPISPNYRGGGAAIYFKQLISDTDPHFIWAQHFGPAQMATLQTRVPVIYSFHDWLHSVQALRDGSAADDLLRQAEVNVARKASAVVCGSAPECEDLRKIGCSKVAYIPVAYDSVPLHVNGTARRRARIVHLGGIGTTANRVGLQRFFEIVWPQLSPDECDLWIVGDMQ